MKFNNVLDYLKAVGLAILLCGTVYISVEHAVSGSVESKVRQVIKEETASTSGYLETLMIKNIIKQADKVQNDPYDIKLADVEQGIRDWRHIQTKTVFIQDKYDIMNKWYQENVLLKNVK